MEKRFFLWLFLFYRQGYGDLNVYKERISVSKFDPRFWEVAVAPERLDKFSQEGAIWYETEAERRLRYEKEDKEDMPATRHIALM